MKNILIVLTLTISFNALSQQHENKWQFTIGYGFGIIEPEKVDMEDNVYFGGNKEYEVTGPFYLKAGYRVFYNLSLGVNFSYARYNVNTEFTYYNNYPSYTSSSYIATDVYESYSFLLRMNYYFNDYNNISKFDPYAGVGIGIRDFKLVETSFIEINPNPVYPFYYYPNYHRDTMLGLDFTLGVNYYFTKSFSIYLEAGLAKSALQGGISFSF